MTNRLLIAGGSGLIGQAITAAAKKKGWQVDWLSRTAGDGKIAWSPDRLYIDLEGRHDFDAIINLTGENVSDGRWNDERKKRIYNSRIQSAATLYKYLSEGVLNTKTFVGASAIGIYGDRPGEILNEASEFSADRNWFVKTVIDWEEEHQKIASLNIRTVLLRIGIVLSTEGGALAELLNKSAIGVLPYFGSGQQYWSWIHIDDLVSMFLFAVENQNLQGVYNATAPSPATNKVLVQNINAFSKRKKIVAGAPKFALQMILGEMHKVVFESANVVPTKMLSSGFQFEYQTIDVAMKQLLT